MSRSDTQQQALLKPSTTDSELRALIRLPLAFRLRFWLRVRLIGISLAFKGEHPSLTACALAFGVKFAVWCAAAYVVVCALLALGVRQ